MRFSILLGVLASSVYAQNQTYCTPEGGVCYTVNVPVSTASNNTGDIYFQIRGPSTMSWIGLGQGSSMTGSNLFFIYADSAGTNVTLSSRLGIGNKAPAIDSTAGITLLSGSGITNDMMVANIRCSNCSTWRGGSMNFTDDSSDWIWAFKTGSSISSDNMDVSLPIHNDCGKMHFNLQNAAGGSSANPFLTAAVASPSSLSTSSSSSSAGEEGPASAFNAVRMAHGLSAAMGFVLLFPFGALGIRLLSFKNLVWCHAGWMVCTYIIVLGSLGMGVWLAVVAQQIGTTHAIVGIVVIGGLLLQPVTGLAHHLLYKRVGGPNVATYPHIWWGRAIITLGIINGGLGLQLSGNTTYSEITYGVVAGFMWLLWMFVILVAFITSREKSEAGNDDFGFVSYNSYNSYAGNLEDSRSNSWTRQSYSVGHSPNRQSYLNSVHDAEPKVAVVF